MKYDWRNPYIESDDALHRADVEGDILAAALGIENEEAEDEEAAQRWNWSK
jgi:hypothetical protein